MSILPRRTAFAPPLPVDAEIVDVQAIAVAGIPAVAVTVVIGADRRMLLLGLVDAEAAATRMLSAVASVRSRWAA
ncbi:hypothetical protein TPB0596_09830 [Tsukamurella pulmonis]|uniref:hypothetical protein n=1 Tax=Tsukamurella pulmonis TaxID=47312 RepID=UPI001EDFEAD7|nr:hypothetical protein [Tsukamurella pulmonis]BDD81220.1 hypothetical protein TPB0596_09830 [Tsukamurella pulmonis]